MGSFYGDLLGGEGAPSFIRDLMYRKQERVGATRGVECSDASTTT